MPSPRPPGLGVEKILVSSHEIPKDHVLHLVVLARCPSEPGVCLLASRLRFFFFSLGNSSPSLSLAVFCTPLPFSPGCPTISGEVSHFITIVTLHLGCIPSLLPLRAVIPVVRGKGWFLILL